MCRVLREVTAKIEDNGRKRYFAIDENVSSKVIYALLDDADNADDLNIDNLVIDSDTEYIVEEKIQPEKDTHNTTRTTPEVNTHVVLTDPQNRRTEKEC